jgi:hypothetical protein
MKKYKVHVVYSIRQTVEVEAATMEDALSIVTTLDDNGEIEIDPEDANFHINFVEEVKPIPPEIPF